MNEQDGLWPRNCDACGKTQAMEFDHEHLACMPAIQLTGYISFWQETVEEERMRVQQHLQDEIARRKASYALWIASRRLGAGCREQRRRLTSDKLS